MRVLMLARVRFFRMLRLRSSEPSATLVDAQPTETTAGTTDTTGAPAARLSTTPPA
jgi:hypothetical protein